ncbi:8-amino-7-oxononanoate synthase [Thiohalobacter thiocyanaticus]|uniref:8-amino-7-oxononanoate synthase n=1 Tax=Thiohalobacter thiocyanaticus TaxID=585455 RepID=A0A1Z4VLQ0_9GAMM|nr:8-amino-7-oxononanoate synthase [Thiohalobacter thiocyanaticus]BAZ92443.1 8-amino-7-oxononanoate synthase [Thiohalobacter thiocyanaticus]
MKDLRTALEQRRRDGLYRSRRLAESPQRPERRIDGRDCLSFCSNDYLGLAAHPQVVAALQTGAQRWGAGSGAAHLLAGHTAAHHALEEELADFVGAPRALLFSTGYMANLGVMAALPRRAGRLFQDRLNHASLLDGARISGARLVRYAHLDMQDLQRRLAMAPAGERLIASDGVFSMDGDCAPVEALAALATEHAAGLLLDDAHGLGVLGPQGRGTLAQAGLTPDADIMLMGTLGKALGTFGAFVAGSEALIETLIQQARSYVYTTAPPAAVAEATRAALQLCRDENWRREHLQSLVARFRAGAAELDLVLMESSTPIQPLLIGETRAATRMSEALEAAGILVPAIRPPTVPEGEARLRISFSAAHTQADVDRLLEALGSVMRR